MILLRQLNEIKPDVRNIFLLWDGSFPEKERLKQIQICLNSIKVWAPNRPVWVFSNVLGTKDLSGGEKVALVRWSYEALGAQTRLAGKVPTAEGNWCLWSDVFRVLVLWRWGGTYFDVDDIMVRSLPVVENTSAACFLTPIKLAEWEPRPAIPGEYASTRGMLPASTCFRFGADPLTSFAPQNVFLEQWMEELPLTSSDLRGQVLPSAIFCKDPAWARRHINPVNWTDLLYQPYEGGHHPGDKRYDGNRISTELLLNRREYEERRSTILNAYSFYLVKNHDFRMHLKQRDVQTFLQWFVQDLWEPLHR